MKRFIEGESRSQITLLPECLDDYIAEDNPVRAVEAFIDGLDLGSLGFAGVAPAVTGRPSYHPSVLLKLYLYGYLNRIQSSRRLERESQRNVELMWLTGKLSPDFKTIADFRHDNGQAIRNVCREFILLCRRLDLFTQAIVAIDGSKFKAVNAHDRNFTRAKVDKRVKEIERSIDDYMTAIETADRNPSEVTETKTAHLSKKIETLKREMRDLKGMQAQLEASGGQVSLTDPDARAMATSTSRGLVGYNVQTAVETEHHLIVAHEVTNVGSDRRQLARMAKQAQEIMPGQELQAIADRGYFNGDEVLACDQAGITACVSKPMTSEAKAEGRFDKSDFVYQPDTDTYRCPAGSQLIRRFARVEAGHLIHRYSLGVHWDLMGQRGQSEHVSPTSMVSLIHKPGTDCRRSFHAFVMEFLQRQKLYFFVRDHLKLRRRQLRARIQDEAAETVRRIGQWDCLPWEGSDFLGSDI